MADPQSAQRGGKGTSPKWDALLALPGEEEAQGQLQEQMRTQGQNIMVQEECRTKSKSSEEMAFYKGLDQIISGDPTSQAKRLATEPKTSSPVSSRSSSTSDLLDSCQELYSSSNLEEDLEREDSFMSSLWSLGEETQDTDLAFPANVIDTVRLGQTHGSSSSPPAAHADEVNACATISPKAVMTPTERLALFKRKRRKGTAVAAIDKLIAHSSSQMTTLWNKLQEWDREFMQQDQDFRKKLTKAIAEEGEAFRKTLDILQTSMDAQTKILKNMVTLMASRVQQGNVGGFLKRKRLNRPRGAEPLQIQELPATPAIADSPQESSSSIQTANVSSLGSRPPRKIKKRVPLSP